MEIFTILGYITALPFIVYALLFILAVFVEAYKGWNGDTDTELCYLRGSWRWYVGYVVQCLFIPLVMMSLFAIGTYCSLMSKLYDEPFSLNMKV